MRKKKSVLVTWTFSYIIILLIPVIAIFINYYYSVKIIKKEIVSANELVLDNVKTCIDVFFDEATDMYAYILQNEAFYALSSHDKESAQFYYDVSKMVEQLNAYISYHPEMFGALYFLDTDYMAWNYGGNYSKELYKEKKNIGNEIEYDQWKELLSQEYNNEFFVSDRLNHKTEEDCIVYADTVSYKGRKKVNVFISIPLSEIEKMTRELNPEVQFLICKKEMMIALTSEGSVEVSDGMKQALSEESLSEQEKYVSLRRDSEKTGVVYYLLIPQQEFWRESKNVRNILCISLCVTLLISFICVSILLRHNFQPVSSLLSKMKDKNEENEKNEFALLENVYSRLLHEKQFMHNKITVQQKIMCNNQLLAMMKGRSIRQWEEDPIVSLKEGEETGLVGFEIPLSNPQQIQHDELIYFIVDNIFSEMMADEKCYKIEDGQYLFYLFVFKKENRDDWKNKCMKNVTWLCELLEDKWNVELLAAVSSGEDEIVKIRFLYQNVMEAFEYQDILGGNGLIDTDMLKDISNDMPIRSDAVALIKTAVEKGDEERMMEVSAQLFNESKQLPFMIFKMKILAAFQNVAEVFYDYEMEEDKRIQFARYLSQFLKAETEEETENIFNEMLKYVYNNVYIHTLSDAKETVVRIIEYVEKHYKDSELNISAIAFEIERNPRYISRIFKEETQEGILDYINRLRIGKAQTLLDMGRFSIEEVSEMVGYASVKTFRRAFYKLTGVMPGKFAENSKLKKVEPFKGQE